MPSNFPYVYTFNYDGTNGPPYFEFDEFTTSDSVLCPIAYYSTFAITGLSNTISAGKVRITGYAYTSGDVDFIFRVRAQTSSSQYLYGTDAVTGDRQLTLRVIDQTVVVDPCASATVTITSTFPNSLASTQYVAGTAAKFYLPAITIDVSGCSYTIDLVNSVGSGLNEPVDELTNKIVTPTDVS